MKICICDDDKAIHEKIGDLLKSFFDDDDQINVSDFFTGEALVECYSENQFFDIIFLDIEMSEMNGIRCAENIRKASPRAIIIFISSHENYVFDTFRFEALHFLRKPVQEDEFSEVMHRALNKYKTLNTAIPLRWQSERYSISIDEIMFIEGYRRHITVHTAERTYEAVEKMSTVLAFLAVHGFVRTHQGFIVNMDYIKRIGTADIILKTGEKIMLSTRKRTDVLKAYDSYLKKRKW